MMGARKRGRDFGSGRALLVACALSLVGLAGPVEAAGGHDHGPRAEIAVSPRAEARAGDKQLVLVYTSGHLVAYLETFADGAPTRGAEVEALINFQSESFPEVAPGVYRSGPVALPGGRNEIELLWRLGDETFSMPVMLHVPTRAAASGGLATLPSPKIPGWIFLLAALALYAGLSVLFWRRTARTGVPSLEEDRPVEAAPRHAAE